MIEIRHYFLEREIMLLFMIGDQQTGIKDGKIKAICYKLKKMTSLFQNQAIIIRKTSFIFVESKMAKKDMSIEASLNLIQ